MTPRHDDPEPIEDYLDELLSLLRLPPRATRRLLAETEDHLRQSANGLVEHSGSLVEAERAAVAEFGSPAEVARAANGARRLGPLGASAVTGWSLGALAATGLLAIGASGLLAALFNSLAGPRFVGALPVTHPASACRYYLAIHPGAHTCSQAAMLETSADAVSLRLVAGLAGLLLLVLIVWARRRLPGDVSMNRLRDGGVSGLAAVALAGAGVFLAAAALDTAVQHGSGGVGWYLSGAIPSCAGAVICGAAAWHRLRSLRPWTHVAST